MGTLSETITRSTIMTEDEAKAGRYPRALEAEYRALIRKKFLKALTESEANRLEAIRAEIDAIDEAAAPDIREIRLQQLEEELACLRAEVETLPDA